jgi:nicotinate-nucleotide pyrophosphorylase (carboxylating)
MGITAEQIRGIIALALEEDLGTGDVTSIATIPADLRATATIVAKAPGVVAGLPIVAAVFAQLDPTVTVTLLAADGDRIVGTPMELARIEGPARSVLGGERTALNILGHLCGVATATRAYVDRVEPVRGSWIRARRCRACECSTSTPSSAAGVSTTVSGCMTRS